MIIRKSNPIPVRQDGAGGIPPALGVETCSAGSHPRASRLPTPTGGSRDKFNKSARHDRLIAPEAQNHGLDNLPDQPGTVVLIGIARHGLGTIVRPFKHIPFHNSEIARG